jgi:hypothetical protein
MQSQSRPICWQISVLSNSERKNYANLESVHPARYGASAVASIDVTALPRPFDSRSKLLALLVLVGLVASVAMVTELTRSSISCERHKGAFSNDFSPDFDINSLDCRASWIKNSPTIRFWGVSPYVGVKW